ncbi:MAG: serine hydrolase domain-containing protein [Paenibacillus dendritiformis]|uniref:serine hydrolase domain-containing protein n=1 Tax=uncultured Paenibacillus sp. TaxID=227322 RepID=UPI0025D39873|nr:serine hydrolase domain-containing protein [uncultured Paenibacillus sp.]MDU5144859.1 serine hydrolase domain-containing protein [Paenibacillus dendritiformis]
MPVETMLEKHFDDYSAEQQYSGTVLVAQEGRLVFAKAYGEANTEHQVANRIDTKFCIASITKPMTALAVLMLMERGAIELHRRAANYLPASLAIDSSITVHHLLTHTSGMPDFETLSAFGDLGRRAYSDEGLLGLVAHLPLEFTPGSGWKYSNTGYNLLGAIIEHMTGISYREYMQEHIWGPLDMNGTDCGCSRAIVPGLAHGYTRSREDGTVLKKAPFFEVSNFKASGNLYSTAPDLLQWDRFLQMRTVPLVAQATLDLMFSPHASVDAARSYGYGLSLDSLSRGHGGHLPGYWSKYRYYPEKKATVIMLSNHDSIVEGDIVTRTAELL